MPAIWTDRDALRLGLELHGSFQASDVELDEVFAEHGKELAARTKLIADARHSYEQRLSEIAREMKRRRKTRPRSSEAKK